MRRVVNFLTYIATICFILTMQIIIAVVYNLVLRELPNLGIPIERPVFIHTILLIGFISIAAVIISITYSFWTRHVYLPKPKQHIITN